MNTERLVRYWRDGAEEEIGVAWSLLESRHY